MICILTWLVSAIWFLINLSFIKLGFCVWARQTELPHHRHPRRGVNGKPNLGVWDSDPSKSTKLFRTNKSRMVSPPGLGFPMSSILCFKDVMHSLKQHKINYSKRNQRPIRVGQNEPHRMLPLHSHCLS